MFSLPKVRIPRVLCCAIAVFGAVLAVLAMPVTATAQPVEYVRTCDKYGTGFFYIPGTETCANANQILANEFGLAREASRAATGVAMAASLVSPYLPTGTNYALSGHWAGFDGKHAFGVSGLMRLSGHLVFSAGIATGLDKGRFSTTSHRWETEFSTAFPQRSWTDLRVLGRAGAMYAW